jgi:hypothetical protein
MVAILDKFADGDLSGRIEVFREHLQQARQMQGDWMARCGCIHGDPPSMRRELRSLHGRDVVARASP